MKARLVTQIAINATSADVFRYLSNLKYHYLWNPHLRSISKTTNLEQGMAYQSSSLLLGVRVRGNNVVTKLLPNKELELENKTGALQYKVNYQLRSAKEKTLLTCTTTVFSESNAFAFTTPVLKLLARRELQTDLQALKISVEKQLK